MNPNPSDPAPGPRERALLERLLRRSRMTGLIHEALLSAIDGEEFYSVVAAMLVSPKGMGFSRAVLFRRDETSGTFRGLAAYGAINRDMHDRILRDLEAKDGPDEDSVSSSEAGAEAELFPSSPAADGDAFWDRLVQQYVRANPLLAQIKDSELDPASAAAAPGENLLKRVFASKGSLQAAASGLDDPFIPGEVRSALPGETLWGVVRARGTPSLVIAADKLFEEEPIDAHDRLHMDWFLGQVGLAVEQAQMIAELRQFNESIKELDRLKSNFLSTISHELRSPLTSILGFVRLLANGQVGPVNDKQKEMLSRVLHHSERLSNIINDLIEIAEIDSGIAINIDLKPLDPVGLLNRTLPKLEPRRQSKMVTIDPDLGEAVPFIRADEKRLGRILYHLIDNAIKFSEEHGVVRIGFAESGGELAIRIADQGPGIPKEKMERIFSAFFQLDNELTRVHEGMGIGLTLTARLAAGTGGRVEVESEPGEGAVFSIIYPVA